MKAKTNWFPGHVANARQRWEQRLARAHLLVWVLDARAPAVTFPPLVREGHLQKPVTLVLNKLDLAEEDVTRRWIEHFSAQGWQAVALDSRRRDQVKRLHRAMDATMERFGAGKRQRRLRVMVAGAPNTGKSTLINQIAGKRKSGTGAKPGVTRGEQWIQATERLQVLDTPGVVEPGHLDPGDAWRMLACGIVPLEATDPVAAACSLWSWFQERGRELTRELDLQEPITDCSNLLDEFARRRGYLEAGGVPDQEKAAAQLLRGFQEGRWGRLSLELPGEDDEDGQGA